LLKRSLFYFVLLLAQVGKLLQHKTDTVAELMLLHEADRLMVQLIKIPRLPARVRGMLYRARFEEKIALFEEVRFVDFPLKEAAADDLFAFVCGSGC
jgi:hypothetical protein